jgi:transposase
VPAIPSWLLDPLWDQFSALLPSRPVYDPSHPLGCHRPRIGDRIIFEKLVQVLRFGCSYEAIADCTCGATTIRERRSEWIKAGIFARRRVRRAQPRRPRQTGHEAVQHDRRLRHPAGPGAGPASQNDSLLLAPTLDKLDDLGPLPDQIRVHLDAGYDSQKIRDELAARAMTGRSPAREKKPHSRPSSAGTSSGPTPGTTPSTGCRYAMNGARRSSMPTSTSPTRSSPSAA